jgi:hypothetical protein
MFFAPLIVIALGLALIAFFVQQAQQPNTSVTVETVLSGEYKRKTSTSQPRQIEEIMFAPFFALALGLVVLAWNVFLYDVPLLPGLGAAGFVTIVVFAGILLFPMRKMSLAIWSLVVPCVIAAVGWVLRANGFIHGVNAVTIVICVIGLLALRAFRVHRGRDR